MIKIIEYDLWFESRLPPEELEDFEADNKVREGKFDDDEKPF
jgi:hypothetical protein